MIQEEKRLEDGSVRWRIKNLGNSLINHRVYNPSMKDFNDYINEGFYAIRGVNTNPPKNGNYYGNLIVLNTDYDRNGTNTYIKQILLTHDRIFIRSCHNTTWGSWKEIIDKTNIIDSYSWTSSASYIKFGPALNKLAIQFGFTQITNETSKEISFPISFWDWNKYKIIAIPENNISNVKILLSNHWNDHCILYFDNKNTDETVANGGFEWIAIGFCYV